MAIIAVKLDFRVSYKVTSVAEGDDASEDVAVSSICFPEGTECGCPRLRI